MSPGPVHSRHGGGHLFSRGRPAPFSRYTPAYVNRTYAGARQRFSVASHNGGKRIISLDPDEAISVSLDDDGNVVVDVSPAPSGNGTNGARSRRRPASRDRAFAASQQKIDVTVHDDGSLTLSPSQPSNDMSRFRVRSRTRSPLPRSSRPSRGRCRRREPHFA